MEGQGRPDGPAASEGGRGVSEPVCVEIYDQIYNLRGPNEEHIRRLALLVDGKMRAVAANGNTVDSLRVAVLAGLNIADELIALRKSYDELAGGVNQAQDSMRSRADTLAGMLDEVLEDRKAG